MQNETEALKTELYANVLPDLEPMEKPALIDVIEELNTDVARERIFRMQAEKALEDVVKLNRQLESVNADLRYRLRSLFAGAAKAKTLISTVRTNLSHMEGFTHHMKSVINQMNSDELNIAENELEAHLSKIREQFKLNDDMSDVPF